MSAHSFVMSTPSRARLTFAVENGPLHWRPIYLAVRDAGVQLAVVEQKAGRIRLPEGGGPRIMVVGDDTHTPMGPSGFHRKGLRRFIAGCHAVAIVSCEPLVSLYAMVATCAAGFRRDALLIESQPEHEQAWIELVRAANPTARLVIGAVRPPSEARH